MDMGIQLPFIILCYSKVCAKCQLRVEILEAHLLKLKTCWYSGVQIGVLLSRQSILLYRRNPILRFPFSNLNIIFVFIRNFINSPIWMDSCWDGFLSSHTSTLDVSVFLKQWVFYIFQYFPMLFPLPILTLSNTLTNFSTEQTPAHS